MALKIKHLATAICSLAAFAVSVPVSAHSIWFAQRAKQLALIYGVGADDLDAVSRMDKLTSVEGFDSEGLPVETTLRVAGTIPVLDSEEPLAIAAATMDYGMWTKDASGIWHNTGKDEVEGNVEVSEHNFKYAVYMYSLDAKVPLIKSQTLQIVPVGPIAEEKGAPLMVKAYYNGKPASGVQILTDYVTDPDQVPAVTGADGTTTIRPRNQGLNVLVGILVSGSDKPAKYDQMEHRASLAFVLPHLPE